MDIVCIAIELYVETLRNKNIGTIATDFFKAFLRVGIWIFPAFCALSFSQYVQSISKLNEHMINNIS